MTELSVLFELVEHPPSVSPISLGQLERIEFIDLVKLIELIQLIQKSRSGAVPSDC